MNFRKLASKVYMLSYCCILLGNSQGLDQPSQAVIPEPCSLAWSFVQAPIVGDNWYHGTGTHLVLGFVSTVKVDPTKMFLPSLHLPMPLLKRSRGWRTCLADVGDCGLVHTGEHVECSLCWEPAGRAGVWCTIGLTGYSVTQFWLSPH